MDKKIVGCVKEQMDVNQCEYYLCEQMKVIGKEFGGGEDSFVEVDVLCEKIEEVGMFELVKDKVFKEL